MMHALSAIERTQFNSLNEWLKIENELPSGWAEKVQSREILSAGEVTLSSETRVTEFRTVPRRGITLRAPGGRLHWTPNISDTDHCGRRPEHREIAQLRERMPCSEHI